MRQFLTVAAGLSGAAAVAAGAIGSHALGSGPGSEAWREVWKVRGATSEDECHTSIY